MEKLIYQREVDYISVVCWHERQPLKGYLEKEVNSCMQNWSHQGWQSLQKKKEIAWLAVHPQGIVSTLDIYPMEIASRATVDTAIITF